MRLYVPAPADAVLERLLGDPAVAPSVTHVERIPARPATTVPFPDWLDPRLRAGLEARGIAALYAHQADALEAIRAGEDVVIVTPTASGKTLCYNLPVLQAVVADPAARALYLFPTKALSQDQVAEFRELTAAARLEIAASTYDGDTPATVRHVVRSAGQVVVTNPDMLHSAILPHHTKWFHLFEQLRYVVIDELHTYRGVFGAHVANVLRRLFRVCAHYGSRPQVVCCSATIANPDELAGRLIGRPVRLIDRNGAPAGARTVVIVNPPVVNAELGVRASASGMATRLALPFLRAGRQTIVFGRSRVQVELMLTALREALREGRGPHARVRGYRSGYLPGERRAVEQGLRSGEVLGVVATNALELGIDVGQLDTAILAGYPGSIAATRQQMGRAGRRDRPAVAFLVAGSTAVDQYVATHPEYLVGGTPEEGRIDPDNLHILLAHLRAATFELPFERDEPFGAGPADELLAFLAEEGHVRQADDGRWYWASENFPASEISLRSAAQENVIIIDRAGPRPAVIGEIDIWAARQLVHPKAIYLHGAVQYHVDELDWAQRKAFVRRVDVDYYTYAELGVTLKPLDRFAEEPATGGSRAWGEVMVASLVTMFKKLHLETHETIGWGPVDLPELEMHTSAYWLTVDEGAVAGWRRDELDAALIGAGRALRAVASVLLMGDPHDLGMVAQVRSPHAERPTIYLYDAVPGGVGLAERLFERHAELIEGAATLVAACPCERGCPSCTGPRLETGGDGKALAARLLEALGAMHGRRGAGALAPRARSVA
ncbi:MAG: ATP-dependent helicase [Chloroflexi bacterium GWC2_73_18]|nr:MAG: ATP-dependent helicase [Chloroflexi bacterium GWC2_73_18]